MDYGYRSLKAVCGHDGLMDMMGRQIDLAISPRIRLEALFKVRSLGNRVAKRAPKCHGPIAL
jgi:hypothetical protein